MGRHFCITTSIAGLKRLIDNGEKIDWLTKTDGTPASVYEIVQAINEAESKGYEVLPACDNVDETGHCKGHEYSESHK